MSLFLIANLGSLHSSICCVCLERDISILERRCFTVISTVCPLTRFRQKSPCWRILLLLPFFCEFLDKFNFLFLRQIDRKTFMLLFVTCLHICQVSTGRLITLFIVIAEVAVRRLEFHCKLKQYSLCSLVAKRGSTWVTSWKKNKRTRTPPRIMRTLGCMATRATRQSVRKAACGHHNLRMVEVI